jgi:ferredoxin
MPRVTIHPPGITLDVLAGTTLGECAKKGGLELYQICEGDGICASCLVKVISGLGNLSPVEKTEANTLEESGVKSTYRLACQARIRGDVTFKKGEE